MAMSQEDELAQISSQIDFGMLGGPLARLYVYFHDHPEQASEPTMERLRFLLEGEVMLMAKAVLELNRIGLKLDPSLLADAEAVSRRERELLAPLLVVLDPTA